MSMRNLRAVAVPGLLAVAGAAMADSLDLSVLETDRMRLVYFDPLQTYLVPHIVRSFENSLDWQQRVLGWTPYEKVTVLLTDFTDAGNAGARGAPNDAVLIDIAPMSRSFETLSPSERIFMIANHELTHVSTMDEWAAQDERWRKVFGGKIIPEQDHPETLLYSYLTAPRTTVPRWYLEGSAVFMETWMAGGIGRAQGAYDEMVFRAMVRDDAHFYDPLGLVSEGTQVDFQVGVNAYLYGTRFISWLALEHSPQKVVDWLERVDGTKRYYADHFEQVFGLPLDDAWRKWIAWEHTFQTANLTEVKRYPLTPLEPISREALGSFSRAFVDDRRGKLYAAVRRPGVVAHVGAISLADGSIEQLVDIKGPAHFTVTSLAYVPQSDELIYTTDNLAYRDLISYDLATGKTRLLQKDARIGDLALCKSTGDLYGIRHLNGLDTLVRMPPPYETWTQVHTFAYGTDVYDIDVSPDGTLLSTSVGEISGRQKLAVFRIEDLAAGKAEPIATQDFDTAVPEGFVFSADGRFLFGSSYYTGVSNVYRYELATKKLDLLTNTDTGLFRPIPRPDGSLIAFSYTGAGFQPVMIEQPKVLEDASAVKFLGAEIAAKYPMVRGWEVGSPSRVDFESKVKRRDKYTLWKELELAAIYPIVEGYKDSFAGGLFVRFADPLMFNALTLSASYSPGNLVPQSERLHAEIEYRHLGWHVRATHNDADFYDLFGPTKQSRRGNSFGAGYDHALIYDKPRTLDFDADLTYYTNLERLPEAQNVAVPFDKLLTLSSGLHYSYINNSLGYVDDEKGWRWEVVATGNRANGRTTPQIRGGLDFGGPVGPGHSTVWLRSAAGISHGDINDPFANFFFGSFGNNYVDHGEIKRYREFQSFPGFDIDAFGGRSFAKSTLEWNLPPLRFEHVGTPGFYLTWLRPAIFGGVLATNPGSHDFDRTAQDLGAQVDLRFVVMHRLDMTLSFGAAAGFADGGQRDHEYMVSLKIL